MLLILTEGVFNIHNCFVFVHNKRHQIVRITFTYVDLSGTFDPRLHEDWTWRVTWELLGEYLRLFADYQILANSDDTVVEYLGDLQDTRMLELT